VYGSGELPVNSCVLSKFAHWEQETSIFERISLLMADILLVVGVTLLVAFVFGEALERVGEPARR